MAPKKTMGNRGKGARVKRAMKRAEKKQQLADEPDWNFEDGEIEEVEEEEEEEVVMVVPAVVEDNCPGSSTDSALVLANRAAQRSIVLSPQGPKAPYAGNAGPGFMVMQQMMASQQEFMHMHGNLMAQALNSLSTPLQILLQQMKPCSLFAYGCVCNDVMYEVQFVFGHTSKQFS